MAKVIRCTEEESVLCLKCGRLMELVDDPMPHWMCNGVEGCGATRDIHPDTGEVQDCPFNPDYIGDVNFDDDEWGGKSYRVNTSQAQDVPVRGGA